jgi:signal transduction histidine kinase
MVKDALVALLQGHDRVLRVIAPSPRAPEATLEVLLDERPMRQAMYGYSWRVLGLSLVISFLTAVLVYLSLQWLMVRPIAQLIEGITRFRMHPEDEGAAILPNRNDEIGVAQREFADMQRDIRAALRQKARLAALGSALAKINHDLRNTLTTAMLVSDSIANSADPQVRRLVPRLLGAIDRATTLCQRTLQFARDDNAPIDESSFSLGSLLADVAAAEIEDRTPVTFLLTAGGEIELRADREQLFRAISNLFLNAVQSGAHNIRASGRIENDAIVIDINDDGPGIPATVRQRLFQPFAATTRDRGSGLGLVICREIMTAHGGDVALAETGPTGTTFRLRLPLRRRVTASSKGLAKTRGIGDE